MSSSLPRVQKPRVTVLQVPPEESLSDWEGEVSGVYITQVERKGKMILYLVCVGEAHVRALHIGREWFKVSRIPK